MRHLIGILAVLLLAGGAPRAWTEVTEVELHIDGLSCPFCVFNIEKPLKKIGAAGSLQTNYKKGVVRMGVKRGQSVDLAQFRQAVADTGFSLRAIRLTAIGTVAHWEGHLVMEARGTGQRFLLFKEEGGSALTPEHTIADPALERRLAVWESNGTLVEASGTVHEHQGLPPALRLGSGSVDPLAGLVFTR